MKTIRVPAIPKQRWATLWLIIFLGLGLCVGCRPSPASQTTLRIAVLPILDTLPLYVASSEGYFAEQGLTVELVPVASAAERDQLLQAGQVDGIITDLVALALYNRATTRVVAVRFAMVPTEEFAQFRVVAATQSGLTTVADLHDIPIGISEGTIIEYVTVRMLEGEGLDTDRITTLAVPKISERMALLNAGELSAATLPEPLASLAVQQGAVVLVDDTRYPMLSCSLFAFRKDVIDQQSKTVRAFLNAVDQASREINADKTCWDQVLADKHLIPPPLMGTYQLPDYPGNTVPTQGQFADVAAWLQATGRITHRPAYDEVVIGTFLSETPPQEF